jgi:hypothetical protein
LNQLGLRQYQGVGSTNVSLFGLPLHITQIVHPMHLTASRIGQAPASDIRRIRRELLSRFCSDLREAAVNSVIALPLAASRNGQFFFENGNRAPGNDCALLLVGLADLLSANNSAFVTLSWICSERLRASSARWRHQLSGLSISVSQCPYRCLHELVLKILRCVDRRLCDELTHSKCKNLAKRSKDREENRY